MQTPPLKLPRLLLTGVDIPDWGIPGLGMGGLGEPAVTFTSVNKGPNHFPSHTEDLELLPTSSCVYRSGPTAMAKTLPPLQSELKSQRGSSEEKLSLEPWVVSFIDRYRPAVNTGLQNNQKLFRCSGYEAGRGTSLGVCSLSGILKSRMFRGRNRRSQFGNKILRGGIASGLMLEGRDSSSLSLDLDTIGYYPHPVRSTLDPVPGFGSLWKIIPGPILGDQCTSLPAVDHNALVTRFPKRSTSSSSDG